jgi:hypothetical protein
MKHIHPTGNYTDGFLDNIMFEAFAMMEKSKELLIVIDNTPIQQPLPKICKWIGWTMSNTKQII